MTTVIVPAERGPERAVPDRVLPVRDRRRRIALLPVVRAAAAARRRQARSRSSSSCSSPPPSPRAGRFRCPTTKGAPDLGRPVRAGLPGYSTVCAPRSSTESLGPVADGADRPVGLLRRRPRHRVGRRDGRRLRAGAEHRRRGARIARRRSRPHVPPSQRRRVLRPARDGGGRADTRLSRSRPRHPRARDRRPGKAMLLRASRR